MSILKQKTRGSLIILSGTTCAGKGTIVKRLLENNPNLELSISYTSRPMRENEIDGVDYYFVTQEEFENKIEHGDFLEYAMVHYGKYYGTPKKELETKLASGKDVILEIEIQGALKVKKKFPHTLLLFVTPPTASELRRRLVNRGTEEEDVIEYRIGRAKEEAEGMEQYDYLIINDRLEECVEEVHRIIEGEHRRSFRNQEFIEKMKRELKGE